MAIPFEEIPSDIKLPLFYAEVKPAQTPFNASLRCLFMGHKNTTGTRGLFSVPYILSEQNSRTLFGTGSMIEAMYRKAKLNAPFAEFWGIATPPDVAGTAAVGGLEVTGTPVDGTAAIWIAGYSIDFVTRRTDTKAQIATRLAAAINNRKFLPCTAAVAATPNTLIDLTCKWKGESGKDIKIELDVWGSENHIAKDLLTATVFGQGGGSGTGNSNISAGLAALGDERYDVVCLGFKGVAAQLDQLDDFMDHTSGRWSPYKQIYGHAFNTSMLSFADLVTLGLTRNGPHVSVMGVFASPTPPWEWTATIGARVTQHWATPPELSRPEQTLALTGIEPARNPSNWFDLSERQSLINAGISTYKVDEDRTVRLERLVTTYQTNAYGDPDDSWQDAITMFQSMFFVRFMRTQITGSFPRSALTDEDSNIPGFASPGQIKDVIVHGYKFLVDQGLVENEEAFEEALIVERNAFDANRVDVLMRPDLVNQLRIVAALVETHLRLDNELLR